MNAEVLLKHFDRISEAPDAIPRLRQFILDMAVRGKLVEQDPNDEPAVALMEKVSLQRSLLEKQGTIKRLDAAITGGDIVPFPIPTNWLWRRFMEVAAIQSDLVDPKDYPDFPHIAPDNIESRTGRLLSFQTIRESRVFSSKHRFVSGCILYSKIRPALAKAAVVDFSGLCSADMYPILALIDRAFLHRYMLSEAFVKQSISEDTRVAMPKINQAALSRIRVPVPPLCEQKRIIARLDELMTLCDQLEQAQKEREHRRNRLTAASVHNLSNGAEGEEAVRHARFYINHLPRLTARPHAIKTLRQTILELAVRGKLVEQIESDEAVSVCLQRIREERASLLKNGHIRAEKPLQNAGAEAMPFPIPESWHWVTIGQASLFTEYGTSHQSAHAELGVPVLKMGDIQDGRVVLGGQKKVPASIDDLPDLYLQKFDLLYNRTNSAELVGKTGIYLGQDREYTFASYLIRIRFSLNASDPRFFNLAMNAPYFRATQIAPHLKQQCGQANVNGTTLKRMLIPFPPVGEQQRIVAKVDALMTRCDQLEAQIQRSLHLSTRLLESVLHQTLECSPATESQRRASENLGDDRTLAESCDWLRG